MAHDTPTATNLVWQPDRVGRERREAVSGHRGAVVWLTGLSGAGKSTIARGLADALTTRGVHAYVLDAENVRYGLNADLGFAPEDRAEHVRRLGEVAKLYADAAMVCIVACISPYRAAREAIRASIGDEDFNEVFVATPLAVCESRDTKGLYRRARTGEIKGFTGVSAPYERPTDPDLEIHTEGESAAASVAHVVAYLEARGVLR